MPQVVSIWELLELDGLLGQETGSRRNGKDEDSSCFVANGKIVHKENNVVTVVIFRFFKKIFLWKTMVIVFS